MADALADWPAHGLDGRSPKTVSTYREVTAPLLPLIGAISVRELTAADVWAALTRIGATRSSRTVTIAHQVLTRAIRHAEATDLVRRNVASLIRSQGLHEGQGVKSSEPRRSRCVIAGSPQVPAARLSGPLADHRHPFRGSPSTPLGPHRPGCFDHLGLAVGESPWRRENADLAADVGAPRDGRQGVAGSPGTAAARTPERWAALARVWPGVRINCRNTARPLPRSALAAAHIPRHRDRRRLGTARPQAHVREHHVDPGFAAESVAGIVGSRER
jgi:hypothetical protein